MIDMVHLGYRDRRRPTHEKGGIQKKETEKTRWWGAVAEQNGKRSQRGWRE